MMLHSLALSSRTRYFPRPRTRGEIHASANETSSFPSYLRGVRKKGTSFSRSSCSAKIEGVGGDEAGLRYGASSSVRKNRGGNNIILFCLAISIHLCGGRNLAAVCSMPPSCVGVGITISFSTSSTPGWEELDVGGSEVEDDGSGRKYKYICVEKLLGRHHRATTPQSDTRQANSCYLLPRGLSTSGFSGLRWQVAQPPPTGGLKLLRLGGPIRAYRAEVLAAAVILQSPAPLISSHYTKDGKLIRRSVPFTHLCGSRPRDNRASRSISCTQAVYRRISS
jgi:hypothetical protein